MTTFSRFAHYVNEPCNNWLELDQLDSSTPRKLGTAYYNTSLSWLCLLSDFVMESIKLIAENYLDRWEFEF